jgi:glycosyltransferase involved in cell wall biosynthesis
LTHLKVNPSEQVVAVAKPSGHSLTEGGSVTLTPKISIIINNFNYERFVEAAIESALGQTYPNVEVIVVDDGSTDGSRDLLKKYETKARVVLKENQGQASAFNAGCRVATGQLIAFLDSDDVLFPEAIETVVSAWKPGIVKMQFLLRILGPDGSTNFVMPRARLSEGNVLERLLKTGRYVTSPTSGNVFARSFLQNIFPIPEDTWKQTGDGYINNCAPFYGPVAAIQRPLGFYRVHGTSMSSAINDGAVDLKQLEKLMRHAYLEKSLIEGLAQDRGLPFSPSLVVSHWMHLKLSLSVYRLKTRPGLHRTKELLKSALAMGTSVMRSDELTPFVKIQHIAWAVGIAVLPNAAANKLLQLAFDQAPQSRVSGILRRT